jgi:molecular chaperone GrpE
MTYPAENPFDETVPRDDDDMTSDDSYARGGESDDASGADESSGGGRASTSASDDVQRALDEQRDRYLRLAAEYDNFRKRTQKERAESGTRAQADLVKQLIDSLDDLSRFAALDPASTDPATVVKGVDLVEKKLRKALAATGLEIIDALDQPFDPSVHEAVATEPALSSEDDNMVARVYQPGYRFNGQLLRPARVVVKQWNG